MARRPQPRAQQRISELKVFPAPTAGWISNRALASPNGETGQAMQGAMVLDNFLPLATCVKLRRGKRRYATLGNGDTPDRWLFAYRDGANKKFFAANDTTIYDITNITFGDNAAIVDSNLTRIGDGDGHYFGWLSTPDYTIAMEGFSGGDWSTTQFAATGKTYLVGVNGQNIGFVYDGERFYPMANGGAYILTYVDAISAFTKGDQISGDSSGTTAIIWGIEDNGDDTGTLIVTNINGIGFTAGEVIAGTLGGAAENVAPQELASPSPDFGDGLSSANMSFVWVYRNRLYFAEAGSMNAWYLPVDSIGGEAKIFPLNGVFDMGGELIFGQRWSLASGQSGGLSDDCVFFSSEGQAAVYQGGSPDDVGPDFASPWSVQGVYRIGKPLGKNAFMLGGGDISVATDIGLIPMSKAIELDYTALSTASISNNISDEWQRAINEYGSSGWMCKIWSEMKLALVAPPTDNINPIMFAANTDTGAWARITGWEGRSMEVFDGRLFIGGVGGIVYAANETGSDDGRPYTGTIIPLFDDVGSPASLKIGKVGRYVSQSNVKVNGRITWRGNFDTNLPTAPEAERVSRDLGIWGQGIWGQSQWSRGNEVVPNHTWRSIGGTGYAFSLAFQVTSGGLQALDTEVIRCEVTYETAGVVS